MSSYRTLRGIGLVAVALMFAAGPGARVASAQDSSKSGQRTEKTDKQKSTEKKSKQTQTTQGSNAAAPMSGFRPDPQTNY
jgi:hypothetical protein